MVDGAFAPGWTLGPREAVAVLLAVAIILDWASLRYHR
jgi:hypothetical protein